MGFVKTYENKQIEVWECDTCTKHCIVLEKDTGKETWFGD